MTIKNRDGSTYRLSSPNPIMRQQDLWSDGSKCVLHNFDYREAILYEAPTPPPPPKKKYQSLEEITPQEIKVPIKESPVPQDQKVKKKAVPTKNINVIYCMPAITVDSHDPLYNESRVSISYGTQFTFEAIITGSTDLMLQFWTNKELTKNSILFRPHPDYRWWKVENIEQKEDGFTVEAVPSSIQPSFRLQP